ncbi:MAG: hypothetical protein WA903_07605, partial [Ornithinimicrobium sp.]
MTSAVAVQAQDDAEETARPGGDEAAETAGPGEDEAEVTSRPVLETEAEAGEGEGPDEGADEFDEDFDIPAADPTFWEDVLTDEGFVNVSCAFDSVSSTIFELNDEPPAGTGWLLLVALADLDEQNGIYDIFDQPYPGEAFSLVDENDVELTLSGIVLCAADIEASSGDSEAIVDDLGGTGGEVVPAVVTPGPAVETDMPEDSQGRGPSAAGLGVALLAAALV